MPTAEELLAGLDEPTTPDIPPPEDRTPQSFLGKVFDILARPNYASAKFFDTLASDGLGAIGDAVQNAGSEFFKPTERLSFSDLIRKHRPDFAQAHPLATTVLGFVGDVALDPTTYLSFGTSGARIGEEAAIALSRKGEAVLAEQAAKAMDVVSEGIRQADKFNEVVKTGQLGPVADFIDSLLKESTAAPLPPDMIDVARKMPTVTLPDITAIPAKDALHPVESIPWHDLMSASDLPKEIPLPPKLPVEIPPGLPDITPNRPPWSSGSLPTRDIVTYQQADANFQTAVDFAKKHAKSQKEYDKMVGDAYDRLYGKLPENPNAQLLPRGYNTLPQITPRKPMSSQVASVYLDNIAKRIRSGEATIEEMTALKGIIEGKSGKYFEKLHDLYYPNVPKPVLNDRELMDWMKEYTGTSGSKVNLKDIQPDFPPTDKASTKLLKKDVKTYYEQLHKYAGKTGNATLDLKDGFKVLTPGDLTSATSLNEKALLSASREFSDFGFRAAEQRVVEMIKAGQTELVDKGGIKFLGKTLVPTSAISTALSPLKPVVDKFLKPTADALGITKIYETTAKLFSRNFQLPVEYVKARKLLEGELGSIGKEVEKGTLDMFRKLDEPARRKIGDLAGQIDDATHQAWKAAQEKGVMFGQAEAQDLADNILKKSNLNDAEQAAYSKMMQGLKDIGDLEVQAGLLKHTVLNYFPRVYNGVENAGDYMLFRKAGIGGFLGSSKQRTFESLKSAADAGFVPETDAAVVYAMRVATGRKAAARKNFEKAVKSAFGDSKTLESLPGRIKEDIAFIANSNFPAGLNNGINDLVEFYDKGLRLFRTSATVLKPAFAVKQFFSNFIQTAAVTGLKAFKALDPRSFSEAAGLLLHDTGSFSKDSALGQKLLDYVMTTPTGQRYTGNEILHLADRLGVIKGTSITGDAIKEDMLKTLKREQMLAGKFGDDHLGMAKFIAGAMKYQNWAGHVEDLSRLSLFMNGLRLGHDPIHSANVVERALFDYSHGLSQFERQVMRRIVPFYSYQRFAIPLVAELVGKHPGRLATLDKTAHAFMSVWNKFESGQQLNADERQVLPGFLLEQPNVFAKFDPKWQAIFRTFNNFSPLDMMGVLEPDQSGNVDWQRTMIKSGLAQMSPILKMPLEFMMDQNFFTGQAISKANNPKAGKIGDVSPEGLLANIAALFGGATAGIPGIVLGRGAGSVLTLPEDVRLGIKKLLGWEEATVNGKHQVFVNPWLAWAATSFVPTLNLAIRMDNPERTPHERALDLLTGVGTVKLNLKQSVAIQQHQQRKQIEEAKNRIRLSLIYGRKDEWEQAQQDLKQLLYDIQQQRSSYNYQNIRG